MKALWITDLHIDEDKAEFFKKYFAFIYQTAIDRNVDLIINTGDTHNYKNQLFATELKMYRDFCDLVTERFDLISLIGNHDWAHPDNYEIHSLDGLKGKNPRHMVVDSQHVLEIGDQRIGFMAYAWTKERFVELRNKMGNLNRLFGHFDLNHFYLSGGTEEVGSWFADDMFEDLEQVYTGHYHTHQQRKVLNTLVTYLGTGYTVSASEANQIKKIAIVDLVTGELEFIDTPFTMHKKVVVKAGEAIPRISEEDAKKGVDFRVDYVGTTEQIRAFFKDKKIPRELKDKVNPRYVDKKEKRLDISVTSSTEEKIRKYVNHILKERYGSVEAAPFDVERLIRMGLNLTND